MIVEDSLIKIGANHIAHWRSEIDLIDKRVRLFDTVEERDAMRRQYLEWIEYWVGFLGRHEAALQAK